MIKKRNMKKLFLAWVAALADGDNGATNSTAGYC